MDTSTTTTSAATAAAAPDPTKHVNYSYGMVLGVDDLTQEFAYHSERDRWMMRDAVGYGTLSGLGVSVGKDKNGDAEVRVAPGTAVTPRGQLVCVSPLQCANLVKWLAFEKNRLAVREHLRREHATGLRLYLVLCYRDCPTDTVPVPGEPCRTEQEATAPSRLKDDFKLELRLSPPAQTEEDALREFIRWLNDHLEFTGGRGDSTDIDEFIERLRAAAREQQHQHESPPHAPRDVFDSPPRARDIILPDSLNRRLLDIAATKLFYETSVGRHDVMRVNPLDACRYFRAAFRLWVTELRPLWRPACFAVANGCADMSKREADDDCLLLAELYVPLNADGRLDAAHDVEIDEERRPFVVHLRMLQEWLTCGVFAELFSSSAAKSPDAYGGGRLPPIPIGDMKDEPPKNEPVKDEPVRDEPLPVRQLVTIQRAAGERPLYRVWLHLDAHEDDSPPFGASVESALIVALDERAVAAFGEPRKEIGEAGTAEPVEMKIVPAGGRVNVFDVALAEHGDLTRFVINLEEVAVKRGEETESLAEFARRRGVKFVGQEGEKVTVFAPPAPFNA